ncbi:MAG: OmpA family protein, partial [Myxococcota bacterium]
MALGLLAGETAHAQLGYAVHVEGAAARMVGADKSDQFGWGGTALFVPELTLFHRVGLELPLGAILLSSGSAPAPDGVAPTEAGSALLVAPGLRVRPFGRRAAVHDDAMTAAGLWLAGGGGFAYTGSVVRPAAQARVGYDLFAQRSFRGGPSFGYIHVVAESDDALRPQDARILTFGFHAAFEPNPDGASPTASLEEDTDRDGLVDARDRCPEEKEDKDGYHDDDGCPDNDDDQDGIVDLEDQCRLQAEDFDQFEDDDGCPDYDNDDDGLPDRRDQCPLEAEDRDGFEDGDGCPDPDNDGDGIADRDDQCPLEPETRNRYADKDGCPDEIQVRVVGDEIQLDDRIHFATNTATIDVASWPMLTRLADLLIRNPTYEKVHIQGHADDRGPESYNLNLSRRRAASVRKMLIRA